MDGLAPLLAHWLAFAIIIQLATQVATRRIVIVTSHMMITEVEVRVISKFAFSRMSVR